MAETFSCPKCKSPLEAHEVTRGVVVHNCPNCFGVLYGAGDLAVPLELRGVAPARWSCPACRKPMETGTAYDGKIELDRCASCGSLWFDAGEIQILRKLSGVENLAGKPEPADEPAPAPAPAKKPLGGGAPAKPSKTTSDDPVKATPPEMEGAKNPDAERAPSVTLDGRTYRHFQTSVPVTTWVLGEFPWVAKIGDTARMRDFVDPPYLASQEVTATESVWSAGEYVEPEEVWAAFAMTGYPPAKRGVAPAQPNPWSEHMGSVWASFAVAAAVCLGAFIVASTLASGASVFDGGFSVVTGDAEKSRVTPVFDVPGRTSNLQLKINSNLDGHWAYVGMALINAETDQAYDFGSEISYYHGYEDGESWSEGSNYATVYLPSVPSGRYYLRVEPETDSPALNLGVSIKRDVPLLRIPVIAILLLLVPAVWAAVRSDAFENTRWMESDHPRTSSDGDDD